MMLTISVLPNYSVDRKVLILEILVAPSYGTEQIIGIRKSLEFDRVSIGIFNEHAALFTYFSFHYHSWLNEERVADLFQLIPQFPPVSE